MEQSSSNNNNRNAADDGLSVPAAPAHPGAGDGDARLAALRERGADQLDPGRFRYLEALDRRARAHGGAVRHMLDERLAQAVATYGANYDAALCALDQTVPELAERYPQAARELQRLQAAGNVRAVRSLAARLEARPRGGPLEELIRHIESRNAAPGQTADKLPGTSPSGAAAPLGELRTVQQFRETWSRLRVDAQLTRSQEKVPENPGPLNSHLLVQRTLRRMQDLSPAYLQRFMAHVDALMWLDGAGARGAVVAGKAGSRGKGGVKIGAGKSR